MNAQRAGRIAMMLSVPVLAVYVVSPVVRARGGQGALLWAGAGLFSFGLLVIVLAHLWHARRRRV